MTSTSKLLLAVLCVPLFQFGGASVAMAQGYPSKAIRVVSPSGAGGPVDTICRALMQNLSQVLGEQIFVENRVGAAGLIGTEHVTKQPPDGYTLLFGFSGPLAIVPHLNPNTPYDPLRDLVPISMVAVAPYILLVHPSVPAKSVKELIALAKVRPGRVNFGSAGTGVGIHMAGELLKVAAGIDIVHVPYKGAAPAVTALIAGEIDMMFNGISPSLPHIGAGRVRALAVGGAKRSPLLPDLPTVMEAGFDFNTEGWYGVLAPRGTPQSVISTLHKGIVKALESQNLKALYTKLGAEGVGNTPDEFARLIRAEGALWAKVIKVAGIKM
ncbi:MAG: tripartite tricarboxylate transporter substrate binding protein [Burkholderiales bacterium]|nr:tripartite tricarboxylate transporter substrate binding protein [Burkholderiales bacterium]